MAIDAQKAALAYVTDEYAKEWQRKTSLETRALAVATAAFALATLFGVWVDRLQILPDLAASPRAKWACITAVALGLLAILTSLAGALLFRFSGAGADDIEDFIGDAMRPGVSADESVLEEIALTYLGQLRAGRTANGRKFASVALSASLVTVASVVAFVAIVSVAL